jgi:shikimate kinase
VRAVLRRTREDSLRPLLNVADRERQIKELFGFRRPFYERAADIVVNTTRLNIDAVVGQVLEKLKIYEADHRQKRD